MAYVEKTVVRGFKTAFIASDAALREVYEGDPQILRDDYTDLIQPSLSVVKFGEPVDFERFVDEVVAGIAEEYEDDYDIIVQVLPNVLVVTGQLPICTKSYAAIGEFYFHSEYRVDDIVDLFEVYKNWKE